jgi:L-fucose isomerase-like protein
MREMTLGVIIGHRGVFPGGLAERGRALILDVLKRKGVKTVVLGADATASGAVSCRADGRKYAALFKENRDRIDGILISLPDFGDEASMVLAVKESGLDVPVYVHAWPDRASNFGIEDRRDSFCGKFSACNNLRQSGIKYTLGELHVLAPDSAAFSAEIDRFLGVCRVVNGLRRARIGCIGARTGDFKTVRFSEKILQRNGITVETVDLSEMLADAKEIKDGSPELAQRIKALEDYCLGRGNVPARPTEDIARFSLAIDAWVQKNELDAYALQCWPSLQRGMGIFPCTFMSFMSDHGMPSACETDVMGAVSMLSLQLATGASSALFDLNNNYDDDPDMMVLFHCSNCPVSLIKDPKAAYNAMAVNGIGLERSYSTLFGNLKAGDFTYARVMTDDLAGGMTSYLGEGTILEKELKTFGTVGVVRIENLQRLLAHLCKNGFEHHLAINGNRVAGILEEAFGNYLGWSVYHHS